MRARTSGRLIVRSATATGRRNRRGPALPGLTYITPCGGDRCDRDQLREYLGSADVATVHDMLAAMEESQCLGPKVAMRVRDDPKTSHAMRDGANAQV